MKLDLHTHCREATACVTPTVDVVERIVAAVKKRGLDGIAITDHYSKSFAYAVKEIVDRHFDSEILVIPGQEIDRIFSTRDKGFFHAHVVELYLSENTVFRFIAHPDRWDIGKFHPGLLENIHGMELRNANYRYEMDEAKIREVAEANDLLLLTNSDAHYLSDIGVYYNELDVEELFTLARSK
jgi:histidinol phosphatase-like PHP family hydrolase